MSLQSRFIAILSVALLLTSIYSLAFASDILLKRLSPDGLWVETGTHLAALPPMVSGKGDWDNAIATINFRHRNSPSNESIIIQATISRSRSLLGPYPYCIGGFANGESGGSVFRWESIECQSLFLQRDEDGGLLIRGTFIFGQLRIDLPLTQVQVTTGYGSSQFDGDRIPNGWDLEELLKAADSYTATPRSRIQEAKILAWRIIEDSRPLRVHYCVLWIRLNNPDKWVLINVARNRYSREPWSPWSRALVTHSFPYWTKFFDHPPTNQEIETFLQANQWLLLATGFRLLDEEICAMAWKTVTGQEPPADRSRFAW